MGTITVGAWAGGYQAWRACAVCGRQVPGLLTVTPADAREGAPTDEVMASYGHGTACPTRRKEREG